MVLAGLLLRISLIGWYLFGPLIKVNLVLSMPLIRVVAMVGTLQLAAISSLLLDVKKMVAYSSVVHISIGIVGGARLT
jgi:NADH:ubiquinone oxidoreductase subunit 4 (subunit M)